MALHVAADKVRPKRQTKLVKPGKPGKPAKKTLMQLLTERRQAATGKSLLLTPEQVDPEFQGTPMEFTTKYGHVQVETAEQRAHRPLHRLGD